MFSVLFKGLKHIFSETCGRMALSKFNSSQCLAFVEKSPEAVAIHDKRAWLDLFASNARVEDPVGSAPHFAGAAEDGNGALARFYETFIAPNIVSFSVDRDIVCGMQVMRDLTIEITMSEQVEVRVPVHLLYELTVEDKELKIARLAAHWELGPMLKQQMASGLGFLKVGAASAVRMLRQLGVKGMAGFSRARSSVGDAGKERAQRFVSAFNKSDVEALAVLFAGADAEVAFPVGGNRLSIAECSARGGDMTFSKVLAAGNVVSATLSYRVGGEGYDGVALFELDRDSLKIQSLSFYW